jgi:hypothetical protein
MPTSPTLQDVPVPLTERDLQEADRLVPALAQSDLGRNTEVTRELVLRLALRRGLEELDQVVRRERH